MSAYPITKRRDGKYEQRFGGEWVAEYMEEPESGMWRVDLFRHDVAEWVSTDYPSLEEAEHAVLSYLSQT